MLLQPLLVAVTALPSLIPGASAAGPASTFYVSNSASNTITSYPTTDSGNAQPAATQSSLPSLALPLSDAFDASGDLWVANDDYGVVEFTKSELASSGSPMPAVTLSDDRRGDVDEPTGLAFDPSGDLWVTDSGDNNVVEFAKSQLSSSGSPTPAVIISYGPGGRVSGPVFDSSGDLWIANAAGNTVVEFAKSQLSSSGSPTPAVILSANSGSLDDPRSLVFDSAGNLWVANDLTYGSIVEFARSSLSSTGSPPATVILSNNPDPDDTLEYPDGLAFDTSGDLWVAEDEGGVVEFAPTQLSSSGSPVPTVEISSTSSVSDSTGLTFDATGDLWVTSEFNHVDEFTKSQLASSGAPTPTVTLTANPGNINDPRRMAFDSSGDLWVANAAGNTITEFDPSQLSSSGAPIPIVTLAATSGSLNVPVGLTFDSSGDLWVSNLGGDTVIEYMKSQLVSSGTPTPATIISNNSESLDGPEDLAFDSSGDLWVVDNRNNTVVEYNKIALNAATPQVTLTIGANSGSINSPLGLAFDASGDLWVTSEGNNTVIEYAKSQLAEPGTPDPDITITNDAGSLDGPSGLAFDSSGNLWVVDYGNNSVVEYGQSQLSSSGALATSDSIFGTNTELDSPFGIAFPPTSTTPGDFTGSGHADVGVYRPSSGVWYIDNAGAVDTTQWGNSTDIPVPGQYNGDGKTDIAVFRPSTGVWYVDNAGTAVDTQWGVSTDIPVPGDYMGNGETQIAVYRPSTGVWYIDEGGTDVTVQWGNSTDIPVPGDYQANGTTNIAVFRPSTGVWYVDEGGSVVATQWGQSTDIPVPGDYNDTGSTQIAIYRPSTGVWYVDNGGSVQATQWGGVSGDVPMLERTANGDYSP